jgi:hypothetical protein
MIVGILFLNITRLLPALKQQFQDYLDVYMYAILVPRLCLMCLASRNFHRRDNYVTSRLKIKEVA